MSRTITNWSWEIRKTRLSLRVGFNVYDRVDNVDFSKVRKATKEFWVGEKLLARHS